MESIWDVCLTNFMKFLQSRPVCVLHFRADWCTADRAMSTRFLKASRMVPTVSFGVLDVDRKDNWHLTKIWGVERVPTVIYFVRCGRKERLSGPSTLFTLCRTTQSVIKHSNHLESIRGRMGLTTGGV